VTVTLHADGSAVVASDAADSGQGHSTMFTQITADILGVDPADVQVVRGDTDRSPFGVGTFGSRTSVVQASALHRACTELRARLLEVAAHELEADPADLVIRQGRIVIKGTSRGVDLADVTFRIHEDRKALPAGMEPSALVATASYDTPCEVPDANGYGNFAANYTCSATIAFVEVDPATGKITILDWSTAEDAGRTLHPDMLVGQVQGGIAQGIGYALGEELLFDASGTMLNPSMVDYQVPTAPEIPLIEAKLHTIESGDPAHPLGNKGIGESGVTPAAAAIANAVYDAIGVPVTSLPLTPEKVLDALDRARTAATGSQPGQHPAE
jgi:aerobic carbon-monoxide dehydrogenase large subunit